MNNLVANRPLEYMIRTRRIRVSNPLVGAEVCLKDRGQIAASPSVLREALIEDPFEVRLSYAASLSKTLDGHQP
jgi:hypothetical protein